MNVSQDAQSNSTLGALLSKNKKTSPFEYNLVGNVPTYARMPTVWSSQKQITYPSTTVIELPRYGILENLWVEFANKAATTTALTPLAPVFAFASFELRARSKVIARLYPQDVLEYYASQKAELRSIAFSGTTLRPSAAGHADNMLTTDKARYKLPFSCMSKLANAFNLKFMEPVELHLISTGAQANIVIPDTTTQHVRVGCDYIMPNPQEEERLKSVMVRAGPQGISRLQWSSIMESPKTFTAGDANVVEQLELRAPYPVFKTVLTFRNNFDTVVLGTAGDGIGQFHKKLVGVATDNIPAYQAGLGSIRLTSSGVTLWQRDIQELLHEQSSGAHRLNKYSYGPIVINWNMTGDATNQTGFLSLKNIADPRLEFVPVTGKYLTTDGNAVAGVTNLLKVQVTHHYYTLEQVSPDDGSVRVRVLT